MATYRVTQVRQTRDLVLVRVENPNGPGEGREIHLPAIALEGRTAEYALSDPSEALEMVLQEVLWTEYASTLDPRDDPALTAGWVTTTDPDAEPITLFNARSGADAASAHQARLDATRTEYATVADPDGILQPAASRPLDQDLIRHHRARVDITRWELVYGELPVRTDMTDHRIPTQTRG